MVRQHPRRLARHGTDLTAVSQLLNTHCAHPSVPQAKGKRGKREAMPCPRSLGKAQSWLCSRAGSPCSCPHRDSPRWPRYKRAKSAGFKQLANLQPSLPSWLSVADFLVPAAKFIAFAHANRSQSLLPALSPGCHLDVHCTFKAIASGALSYQAA